MGRIWTILREWTRSAGSAVNKLKIICKHTERTKRFPALLLANIVERQYNNEVKGPAMFV